MKHYRWWRSGIETLGFTFLLNNQPGNFTVMSDEKKDKKTVQKNAQIYRGFGAIFGLTIEGVLFSFGGIWLGRLLNREYPDITRWNIWTMGASFLMIVVSFIRTIRYLSKN